jgi:hypothetical protein
MDAEIGASMFEQPGGQMHVMTRYCQMLQIQC